MEEFRYLLSIDFAAISILIFFFRQIISAGLSTEDEWALNSQMNAVKAMNEGKLDNEIFPVEVKQGEKVAVMDKDEGPRPETTLEGLSKLPPVFGHLSRKMAR